MKVSIQPSVNLAGIYMAKWSTAVDPRSGIDKRGGFPRSAGPCLGVQVASPSKILAVYRRNLRHVWRNKTFAV